MKVFILSLFTLLGVSQAFGQAVCPPGYVPKPFQDCPGAIALCNIENTFNDNDVCGEGRLIDETIGSCGTNERTTSWYQFVARRPGRLRFRIIPNDVTGAALTDYSATTGQGNTDYDFVLFKLPPGTNAANTATCNLIGQNPRNNQYEVSCNYSGARGVTGVYDELGAAGNGRFEDPFQVNTGDFFILLVDNFTITDVGYKILFDDPDTDPLATDVRQQADPPFLQGLTSTPNCLDNRLIFSFNKPVLCSDVNTFTFAIKNANYPNQVFRIDSIRGGTICDDTLSQSQSFILGFSPVIIDSTYSIILQQQIRDICGNVITRDTLNFTVRPFVRLEPFVNTIKQDSACCGVPVQFKATPDEQLRAPIASFTYTFYNIDTATGIKTPILGNADYRIDTNKVTTVLPCRDSPIREKIRLRVISTNPRFGCIDSSTATFRYNPKPKSPFAALPGLCFGEAHTIALNTPADTGLYVYSWTSQRLATPRLPKAGILTVIADSVNSVDIASAEVRRAKNDEFRVGVKFKPQFGGCSITEQRQLVSVGSYMKPEFTYDTIRRPGKPGTPDFVLPAVRFNDLSIVRTLEPSKNGQATALWTVTDQANNAIKYSKDTLSRIDSLVYIYPYESKFTINLRLRDTVANGKNCDVNFSQAVEAVFPVVPNLLTRNNDNNNDYFEIPGLRQESNYSLIIFNRWGRKVYEKENYDNTFQSTDLPPGTYFYNLSPKSGPGRAFKGWMELSEK